MYRKISLLSISKSTNSIIWNISCICLFLSCTHNLTFYDGRNSCCFCNAQEIQKKAVEIGPNGEQNQIVHEPTNNGGSDVPYTDWETILKSEIVANGNVFSPDAINNRFRSNDHDECLLLLTHSAAMKFCPKIMEERESDDFSGIGALDREGTILRYERDATFRGAFFVPFTKNEKGNESFNSRLWFLCSRKGDNRDTLEEFDLRTGKVLQIVQIPYTKDAHDAIRVGNSVFIVDTGNGAIQEVALPKPMVSSSLSSVPLTSVAEVIHRYEGFTRVDHPNNVAIHPDLFITTLHGSKNLHPSVLKGYPPSRSRLSMYPRHHHAITSTFNYDLQSDLIIDNIGESNHNIAFYFDEETSEHKLLSMSTRDGCLISITLNNNEYKREILWQVDLTKPYFQREAKAPYAKGLAVQGDIVYFGIAGKKHFKERVAQNDLVLIAFDLVQKKQIWAKSAVEKRNSKNLGIGITSQIVTMEYLNYDCHKQYHNDGVDMDACFRWPDESVALWA